MLESKGTIKSTVLNYGLIMGGLSVAFTLMLFIMDMHYQNSSIQQWTGLLIMAGSIVFGQIAYKKANDGFISLGEGMKIGIGIVALGSSIGILYWLDYQSTQNNNTHAENLCIWIRMKFLLQLPQYVYPPE